MEERQANHVRRTSVRTVALCAMALALVRYLPVIDRPFAPCLTSQVAVNYGAMASRYFDDYGFFALKGAPHIAAVPTSDRFDDIYYNHPPAYAWANHLAFLLCGRTPRGLRLAPALFASIAAAFFAATIARVISVRAAVFAALLFAATPLSFSVGEMLTQEAASLAAIIAAVHFRERMSDGVSRAWPICVAVFCGMLCDWPAIFVIPALLLRDLTAPRDDRRPRALLAAAAGAAAAASCVIGLFAYWSGSFTEAVREILGAGRFVMTKSMTSTITPWFSNQARFLAEGYGYATLAAALAGLVLCFCARGSRTARVVFLFFCPGLIHVAVFWRRALDHEYWWYLAMPGILAAAAFAAESLPRASRVRRVPIFAGILVAAAAYATIDNFCWSRDLAEIERKTGEAFNRWFRSDDLVLTTLPVGINAFYAKCRLREVHFDDIPVEDVIAMSAAGKTPVRRVAFLMPPGFHEAEPDAARALTAGRRVHRIGIGQYVLLYGGD